MTVFPIRMIALILLLATSAAAQDDVDVQRRIENIIEGTRSLEDQLTELCQDGDVLACFRKAGLECRTTSAIPTVAVCLVYGQPAYRLTRATTSSYWDIEVLNRREPD